MNRIMLRKEVQKLLSVRMIPCILVIFLILNAFIISSSISSGSYAGYVSGFARQNGVRICSEFTETLQKEEDSEFREILVRDSAEAHNIYGDFDAMEIYSLLEDLYPMCRDHKLLENKYNLLQGRADVLRKTGEAMDVSAAGHTYALFSFLFSVLFPLLSAEIMILAAAVSAALSTYEYHAECVQLIFSRKYGRNLFAAKYTVSMCALLFMTGILLFLSLLQVMNTEDLYSLFHSSVSSQFNYRFIALCAVPFITWIPMSTLQYLLAQCALMILLGLIVHGACFAAGCRMNNALHVIFAFILVFLIPICAILCASESGNYVFYSLCMFNPAAVWFVQGSWFTDLGINSLIPMQETVTVCAYLLLMIVGLIMSQNYEQRKDIR